jgi:hypothetical protein
MFIPWHQRSRFLSFQVLHSPGSVIGLGRKFLYSFFRESFREIYNSFSRKILYEKTKLSRKFSQKLNFWFRENAGEKITQRQILFICLTKNIRRSRSSVKMMGFCYILNRVGDESFRFGCFRESFREIYFSFSRKNLGESFRENLIVVVLEPLRFGTNQMRLSAALALLKWPYKSCHHRNWL